MFLCVLCFLLLFHSLATIIIYSALLFPQFAICFSPFGVPAPSLPALLPFLAQQPLFHSLSVRPPPQPLFLFLSFWDGPLSTLPVSVLSSVSHHKWILPQEQVTGLFCTANTLLSQISLTALLYSPLNQDYYFPQLHKLSSLPFRDRTQERQKLHVRNLSVVMSSVMLKTRLQDKAKPIYKITACLSPTEIQGFPSKEDMRGFTGRWAASEWSTGLLGGGSGAVPMWQLANYAANKLAVFQLSFRILSEDVLETVEQDGDDS